MTSFYGVKFRLRTLAGGIFLPRSFDGGEYPQTDHDDGAGCDPMGRHAHKMRDVSESGDEDGEADSIDSERHVFPRICERIVAMCGLPMDRPILR
jgi:hypothetical protein